MTFPAVPFLEVFEDASRGNVKTKQSEFLEVGEIPVVDQGQQLVAGYVNDRSRVCKAPPPVVVFGDHTRAIKYVDFEFAMGADGTKVLVPKVDGDTKYLYYVLRSLRLPDAGYSRHYKFLKETTIPLPPLAEQKRIAGILDAADELRTKRRESIEQLDTLLQSVFLDMFGDPVTNPKGWGLCPMADLVHPDRPITYGILKPGPDVLDGVPYVRVVDIKRERVLTAQLRRTTQEIAEKYRRSRLEAGDLLMSIRGHVGRMAIVPTDVAGANITQDTARLALVGAEPSFVMQCLTTQSMQQYMARRTKGVAVKGINLGDVKKIPIPAPPQTLQRQFAAIVESTEQQQAHLQAHLCELDVLAASLQSRAFRGQL